MHHFKDNISNSINRLCKKVNTILSSELMMYRKASIHQNFNIQFMCVAIYRTCITSDVM